MSGTMDYGATGILLRDVKFSPTTGGIIGTPTNDSASAGIVGEIISSSASTTFNSGTPKDLTSITLTAGNWIIFASAYFHTATSMTQNIMNVGTTTGSIGGTQGIGRMDSAPAGSGNDAGANVFLVVSISSSTTYFLTIDLIGTGTLTSGGQIFGVRIR